MAWTDNAFPTSPDFPTGHDDLPMNPDFYDHIVAYIKDMTPVADSVIDGTGNITIGETKGIYFANSERIDRFYLGVRMQAPLSIVNNLVVLDAEIGTLLVAGIMLTETLTVDGDIDVAGSIVAGDGTVRQYQKLTKTDAPGAAGDNTAKIWLSSGVGYGDDGDLVCDIRADDSGQTNKNFTLVDYSGL